MYVALCCVCCLVLNSTDGAIVAGSLQGLTLPIGLCVLHGPYGGPESDAGMKRDSGVEDDLRTLSDDLHLHQLLVSPEPLCAYGDNAYMETLHIVRATAWALASQSEKDLNDVMKPVRVLVEQNFAVVSQVSGIVRVKLQLGSGPIGLVYPVATLLTNIYCLLYGNVVACSVPGALEVLSTITVGEYLDV